MGRKVSEHMKSMSSQAREHRSAMAGLDDTAGNEFLVKLLSTKGNSRQRLSRQKQNKNHLFKENVLTKRLCPHSSESVMSQFFHELPSANERLPAFLLIIKSGGMEPPRLLTLSLVICII